MLPEKKLDKKTEKSAPGKKKAKGWVTILNYANACSSLRLPLMVVGTTAKPRILKNTGMNVQLFKDWFFRHFCFSSQMLSQEE